MTGKTHKIGGLCVGSIITTLLIQEPYTINKFVVTGFLLSGSLIGSLMPDIDHPESTIGRKFKTIPSIINSVFGHRGITHSPLIHLFITAILLFLAGMFKGFSQLLYISFVIGLFAGGISHLILDSMTVSGIPLLYPFTKKKYRLAKFITGKHDFQIKIILIITTLIFIKLK